MKIGVGSWLYQTKQSIIIIISFLFLDIRQQSEKGGGEQKIMIICASIGHEETTSNQRIRRLDVQWKEDGNKRGGTFQHAIRWY